MSCPDSSGFGQAEAAARQADATVLVVGLSQAIERESLDRGGLLLPGHQQELVSRIARASKGPVILVLMTGGPIDVTFAKFDPKISGILWAGYPGQGGGTAIADVIFGTTNPGIKPIYLFYINLLYGNVEIYDIVFQKFVFLGGKLPMTWYPQNYLAKVPMTDMSMRANPSRGYPGRTYRFYRGPTVFPFGFGLSYTAFRQTLAHGPTKMLVPHTSPKSFSNNTLLNTNGIRVSNTNCDAISLGLHIDVENVGEMDGTHTMMLFASSPTTEGLGEEKRLVAFEKVHVAAGAKESVKFNLDPCTHLSVVDKFGIRRIPMGEHSLHFGEDLKHTILLHNNVEETKF